VDTVAAVLDYLGKEQAVALLALEPAVLEAQAAVMAATRLVWWVGQGVNMAVAVVQLLLAVVLVMVLAAAVVFASYGPGVNDLFLQLA
jgi:hypothetical protein